MGFEFSQEQLGTICRYARLARIVQFLPLVNSAIAWCEADSALRAAMFVAQIAHESGEFRYLEEIADGSQYEGRADLGNTEPGDGRRYKGRGLIQVTGRSNYTRAGSDLGLDLVNQPQLAADPANAALIAAWFWKLHGLNQYADARDLATCTRRINGGENGMESRQRYYDAATMALGCTLGSYC